MTIPAPTITADTIRPLTLADYAHDREEMVDALFAAGATAVYEIGSVGAPGISDLDLAACFADDDPMPDRFAAVRRLIAGSRTFLHAPWAMRQRHLALLPSLFAVRQLKDVRGGTPLCTRQTPVQRLLWNVEACASIHATLQVRRQVSSRSAVCLLNGVRYNIELAAEDGIRTGASAGFVDRIQALRRDWFGMDAVARTRELCDLWSLAGTTVGELLDGYAAHVRTLLLDATGESSLRVPGAKTTYYFSDRGAPKLLLTQPLNTIVALPQPLGALFQLLAAPGLGLDRWLSVQRLDGADDARIDPAFAHAAHAYARDNAVYLGDMLRSRLPFLLLGAGTLMHVRTTAADRVMGILRRVGRRLAPARS